MIQKLRNITAISVFLTVLLLASSAFGTNWFVDTTLATGLDDGSSMDNAWKSIKTAFESTGFSAGDYLWVRRTSSFASASANITVTDDGTSSSWIHFVGCPRNSHAISSSDWTNGSTSVNVDDADMDREKHQGRYITAPDSRVYLITRVVDASTITIDREYVGSTVSNAAATISADEDYATFQAISDSGWTIKKADWNADADDLPKIDFESTSYYLYINGSNYVSLANIEIANGAGSYFIRGGASDGFEFIGCLMSFSINTVSVQFSSVNALFLRRCIIVGSGSGTNQHGIFISGGTIKDCAIYNCGGYGLVPRPTYGTIMVSNTNIGVEQANGGYDVYTGAATFLDCKLGGTHGYIGNSSNTNDYSQFYFENYQKILGYHYAYNNGTISESKDVVAGSGDPYKRTGGSDKILSATIGNSTTSPRTKDHAQIMFEHTIYADTSSKSYRYYVQLKDIAGLTADQLYVECTYVSGYDDTTEYQTTTVYSDETPAVRTGADDWSQYIEVTGIQPAVASNVHLRVRLQGYDADGYLFIDPLPYIY